MPGECSEDIRKVLTDLGLETIIAFREVVGGADSSVWKIDTIDDSYALRLLPLEKFEQFVREQTVIETAIHYGVPVPAVKFVKKVKTCSAMLMEWASGQTVMNALLENSGQAFALGTEFGKMQAHIHEIPWPLSLLEESASWLLPRTPFELKVVDKIKGFTQNPKSLLHLDYHPLNVLTDGKKITAVLDWANASPGDSRYDLARTLSILQIEGRRPNSDIKAQLSVIAEFEEGWALGSGVDPGNLSLFNAWAGYRMITDLNDRRGLQDLEYIRQWAESWLN